jgi:penicillin-binding protein 1A
LGLELGTQSVIDEARKFGLTTPIPGYPSIIIGAADVYPIEMVAAYTTFATLGTRAEPIAIARVEDQNGNTLWEPQSVTVPVLSPEEAWLMVSVMKDVVQRGTAAGSVGSVFHYPAGGKTGTTNDGTDVWFIGYTSDLVAGVWMGFDKPQKIKANAQGGILAAPAWSTFMNEVYRRRSAPRDWPMPADIVTRQIDVTTNMLATAYCPPAVVANEFYIPGTDPIQPCDVHVAPALYPDTSGGVYPPTSAYPASPYPPGGMPDTSRMRQPPGGTGSVVPGTAQPIRPGRTQPVDTSRRMRDSTIFQLPRRDTTRKPDTASVRPPKPPRPDTMPHTRDDLIRRR